MTADPPQMIVWNVRISRDLKELMQLAADVAEGGLSLSDWVRQVMEAAARAELLAAGQRTQDAHLQQLGLSTVRRGGEIVVCRHPADARAQNLTTGRWLCLLCRTPLPAPRGG